MFFIIGMFIYFVIDKAKNKIICHFLHRSCKMIMWKKDWHLNNQYNKLLDWILL
jgi:hypothetical protein